jgi:hypothetical protein
MKIMSLMLVKYLVFRELGEEVQNPLNQKFGLKSLRAVDFASRFVLLIKSKFKIRTFNNYLVGDIHHVILFV